MDTLWVAPDQHGVALIYLETTSFQECAFLRSSVSKSTGKLDEYSKGIAWYHMRKLVTEIT